MSSLVFEEPLPGLAPHTAYTLDAVDSADGLFSLQPAEAPEVRLFLLEASTYVPSYTPDVSAVCRRIGLDPSERPRILVVATPGSDGTTVNLAAPVLVNDTDGRAVQAVLEGWPLRAPLAAR